LSIWTKTSSGWVEIGGGSDGLEGLGGWAVISEVSGSPKRYAYNDGGTDWVAFEWKDTTGTHSCKTTEGLLEVLLVSGGGGKTPTLAGNGGDVKDGVMLIDADDHEIIVGKHGLANGDFTTAQGTFSRFGTLNTGTGGVGSGQSIQPPFDEGTIEQRAFYPGVSGILNGQLLIGGRDLIPQSVGEIAGHPHAAGDHGVGQGTQGAAQQANADGVVIVRVPADLAAGVDPGSWVTRIDHYAEVTDGIVTDTYQERFYGDDTVRTENGRYASPEQPDDLIPCDPNVAEGWTYADGEFTPPPPDPSWREEAIEALKQQLKDLQKDQ
jgi:hypothetical protein